MRNTVLVVALSIFGWSPALLAQETEAPAAAEKSHMQKLPARTVHFPRTSVGKLYLLKDLEDRGVIQNKPFSEAIGDVKVPAGKFLLIDVSFDGAENLDWTKGIKTGDIQSVMLMRADLSEDDCKKVALLHGLLALDLRESDLSGKGFQYLLEGLPSLEQLNINRTNVTDEAMGTIAHLRHLKKLRLASTSVTNKGIEQLAGLVQLEHLDVAKTRITDKAMITVAKLKNLTGLNISDNFIGDQAVDYVSKLPELVILIMSNTRITDNAFKSAARLRKLNHLDASNTKITDQGVKYLVGLPIFMISLDGTLIDDKCVPNLCTLPFFAMNLSNTSITPAGVARLRAARKGSSISHDKDINIVPP